MRGEKQIEGRPKRNKDLIILKTHGLFDGKKVLTLRELCIEKKKLKGVIVKPCVGTSER